jgi:hypothetical protein
MRRLQRTDRDEPAATARSVVTTVDEGGDMGKVIASITTSVDGYVTVPTTDPVTGSAVVVSDAGS